MIARFLRWAGWQLGSPRDRAIADARAERRSRVRHCACCGEPTTRGRWCSASCFYHEDGWERDE